MGKILRYLALAVVCSVFALTGCDVVTRHKVLSTIFDGVPSLPPPEQFCQDYAEKVLASAPGGAAANEASAAAKLTGSTHRPYGEKSCNGCHDKEKPGGLIAPKDKLCFVCHKDFIKGRQVHGPVAAADCLACHEPHSSAYPSLLKAVNGQLCSLCHREERVAATMHARLTAKGFECIGCHDPHSGNTQYFLK